MKTKKSYINFNENKFEPAICRIWPYVACNKNSKQLPLSSKPNEKPILFLFFIVCFLTLSLYFFPGEKMRKMKKIYLQTITTYVL